MIFEEIYFSRFFLLSGKFTLSDSFDLAYKSIDWFLYEENTDMKNVTGLSLKQIKPTFLGGESPTLKIAGLVLFFSN